MAAIKFMVGFIWSNPNPKKYSDDLFPQIGGLLELPTHFPNGQNSLENMCLLWTVIYAYLEFGDPERFKKVEKIAKKNVS